MGKQTLEAFLLFFFLSGCIRSGPNEIDRNLFEAIEFDDLAAVKFAITQGADINVRNEDGYTPLERTALRGNKDILVFLLSKGAIIYSRHGLSPLHWAIRDGHVDVALILINNGADVNAVEPKFGWTPLHWAGCTKWMDGVAEALIAHGADVNAKDYEGKTPLDVASDWYVEEVLKKHGAKSD